MADNLHLAVAGFVFLMLLIGIVLTIVEFRRIIRDSENNPDREAAGGRSGALNEGKERGGAGGD